MAVPDFQTLMRPLLECLADGGEHRVSDLRGRLAEEFALSRDDIEEMLPSGRVTTFQNRVGWAVTYLYRCGLISRPRRATYRIAERGRAVLATNPERVDLRVLSQFPEFAEFRRGQGGRQGELSGDSARDGADPASSTPEERMADASRELRSALAAELLERVLEQPPEFFEQLVLDVLHAMGYGGSGEDAVERLGRSGDEGVDGVIREDPLGLDVVYVQAKRWTNAVGRPEVQRFVGALHGQGASKGVMITTSSFSREAAEYASRTSPRVILVDGRDLAQRMIEYGVGVTVTRSYKVMRCDIDYFVAGEDDR